VTSAELTVSLNELLGKIDQIEKDIQNDTNKVIEEYKNISENMDENQSYFLSGIQYGVPGKSYLLTAKGIEVLGEEIIEISKFINDVITFANNPKRKIELLRELITHLNKSVETKKNNTS
jgi:hypothetical protein